MSRTAIASEVGLTAESYANYELERAPVRYGLIYKLTQHFPLNPGWLATGDGPKDLQVHLPPAAEIGSSPRELFSAAFTDTLAKKIQRETEEFFEGSLLNFARVVSLPRSMPINARRRAILRESVTKQVAAWIDELPDSELVEFINRVVAFADQQFARAALNKSRK